MSDNKPVEGITAVFWDFGGVILASPFDAFNEYEEANGLPKDFIRSVNAVDPDTNAWAKIERQEISGAEFDVLFGEESERLGHRVSGADVLGLLSGTVRPEMVEALDRVIAAGYVTACLTNNINSDTRDDVVPVMERFGHVVESSKVGYRKPEPKFYERGCELAGVTPEQVVYLDDLGINLKPRPRDGDDHDQGAVPDQAITDLEESSGFPCDDAVLVAPSTS